MEVARPSVKHVSFDRSFLEQEEKRKEEKEKLLKMEGNRKKTKCREMFRRLTDRSNEIRLTNWMAVAVFRFMLVGILDAVPVPVAANQTNIDRVYAMAGSDFDSLYDNNEEVRELMKMFLGYVEGQGLRFANLVTPENSPQNSAGRRGGDGDGPAGDGAPMAA